MNLTELLSGKKKPGAVLLAVATVLLNHFFLNKPDPDLDKIVATLTGFYLAAEALVDAARALGRRFLGEDGKPNPP